MEIEISHNKKHIFILGAGSSKDYCMPTWNELSEKVTNYIKQDTDNKYKYKSEIHDWLKMLSDNKYLTIDECISNESVNFRDKGDEIENEIFTIFKDIFIESYKPNNEGWIKILNIKILQKYNLEDSLFFINYNYDQVLEDKLLNFEFLSSKETRHTYRERISPLSTYKNYINALYPHGNLFTKNDFQDGSKLRKIIKTIKTGDEVHHDAISCHDSKYYTFTITPFDNTDRELYILGLGGGLKVNLEKLGFDEINVSNIHITITDPKDDNEIIGFLCNKFLVESDKVKVYRNCVDLINSVVF